MSAAEDELRERRDDAGERVLILAALAALLVFLSARARLPVFFFVFAGHFSPLLPAGRRLSGEPGELVRAAARDGLQDFFSNHVRALAFTLAESGDVAAWRDRMRAAVTDHLLAQASLVAGRNLLPSESLSLLEDLRFELDKLDDFAEDIRRRRESGSPLSARAVAARSELYSGSGRAVWFRADEVGKAKGVVIYYEAVDDSGTCSPCLDAEAGSPYLPGLGPYPGVVCRGRGRCRCVRIPRDAPKEFEMLQKRKAGRG